MNEMSPFHSGERALQDSFGVRDRVERIGQQAIHAFVPDAYRRFLATLSMLFVGSSDRSGRPWASVVTGTPGFISVPDAGHIEVAGSVKPGDPLSGNVAAGSDIALLGIDLQARRRVRVAGKVINSGVNRFRIAVEQSFGNCPQYIHARRLAEGPGTDSAGTQQVRSRPLENFAGRNRSLIERADTFYIATRFGRKAARGVHGADISHKGGRPGFIRMVNERLLHFPDFAGNNFFNTLGNLVVNPRAGLLVPDFDTGSVMMLSGSARIIPVKPGPTAIVGAKHIVEFEMERGVVIDGAMPRWHLLSRSPDTEHTGVWRDTSAEPHAVSGL